MTEKPAAESSQVAKGDWQSFLSTFSTENRGRPIDVEVVGMEVGSQTLASGAKPDATAYDPAGKGDDVVISLDAGGHHPIRGVTELWTARTTDGEIVGLEFVDQGGVRTIIQM